MNYNKKRIAIFASGAGSNARVMIQHFAAHPSIEVALVACNKPGAGVIQIAQNAGIPVCMIERERFTNGDAYLPELKAAGVNFIVLAGFLWKIPALLVAAFPKRIVNIHPALLPAFGGKGMYGSNVHAAVLKAGETTSGITIHWVDEHYDKGDIIFQAECPVLPRDTPEDLAARIHFLEHQHYARVVEELLVG